MAEVDTVGGVVVVRNGADGLWRRSEEWRVVEEFRVGNVQGNPDEELATSRNNSVTLGPNGQIFVLEFSTDRILVFSGDGEFVRSFGRSGEGPGEFRSPMAGYVLRRQGVGGAQIAARLGFSGPASWGRFVGNLTGKTPTQLPLLPLSDWVEEARRRVFLYPYRSPEGENGGFCPGMPEKVKHCPDWNVANRDPIALPWFLSRGKVIRFAPRTGRIARNRAPRWGLVNDLG